MDHIWKLLSDEEKSDFKIWNKMWKYYRCQNCKFFKAISLNEFEDQYFEKYNSILPILYEKDMLKCNEIIMIEVLK